MTRGIINALYQIFNEDLANELPEYCQGNTGEVLLEKVKSRVPENQYWYVGDRRALRQLYSAFHTLNRLHNDRATAIRRATEERREVKDGR